MSIQGRWVRCVDHRGEQVREFVEGYFADSSRQVLLVAGAGFDPRSTLIARLLNNVLGDRMTGLIIREERPEPDPGLVRQADEQLAVLQQLIPEVTVIPARIFDTDGTSAAARHVVSGRQVANLVQRLDLQGLTDVVLDFSALSIGTSFPLARTLLLRVDQHEPVVNFHAMVTSSPITDSQIVPIPSSFVGPVHGFQGRWGIDETARAAKLWLPQLRLGQGKMLQDLYTSIRPDEVVPVLPFPAQDPRLGDLLIERYAREIENEWAVDARNIIYAAEGDPLDFYRSVLRLDAARRPVFEDTIGSLVILSPLGSKALALGCMLAAIERDLPVIYVESLGYRATFQPSLVISDADLVHVWLSGDAYLPRR